MNQQWFNLHANLIESISKIGYHKPTEIQEQTIPLALKGKDICGVAKTGQGKTAAFVLPALNNLLLKPQILHTLIISPTRELALQTSEVCQEFGKESGLKVAELVGGVDISRQQIQLAKKPHFIVCTPGRLIDHLQNTAGFNLNKIKFLIIDECDKLLDLDFEKDLHAILKRIPKTRQNLLFTATMTKRVKALFEVCSKDAEMINCSQDEYKTNDQLIQKIIICQATDRLNYLVEFLDKYRQRVLIFCQKITDVQKVYLVLINLKFQATLIHSQLTQQERLDNLEKFRNGACSIMLASDVASRGLDIEDIQIVVNYDVPLSSKDYIHRVGRTARAGQEGLAVMLVCQQDIAKLQAIEEFVGVRMEKLSISRESAEQQNSAVAAALRAADLVLKKK